MLISESSNLIGGVDTLDILKRLSENIIMNPEKVAIFDDDKSFTYGEVGSISNEIANVICQYTTYGDIVTLDLEHSPYIILVVLGILKAGCTYVPLGAQNSIERNSYIKNFTHSRLHITDRQENEGEDKSLIINDSVIAEYLSKKGELLEVREFPENPYILFTSGSTGEPKGVKVTKYNLSYILENMQSICPGASDSVFCFSTPYTFDVATTEIFGWIISNSSVYSFNLNNFHQYKSLLKKIDDFKITHFSVSPSLLGTLFNISNSQDLLNISNNIQYLIVAGEEMPVKIVEFWQKKQIASKLYNFYGPTETSVYATYYEVPRNFNFVSVPIGKPLEGASYFVENPNSNGIGELMIIGEGVSEGYINNQFLNETQFGKFYNGEKFYRTGDLVSVNSEGEILYHGRKDDQIEINGIRVELGEIDHLISKLPTIQAVKTIQYNGILVSFIITHDTIGNESIDFRDELKKIAPNHLIPASFYIVEKFPLNSNNKIDKKELIRLLEDKAAKTIQQVDQNKGNKFDKKVLKIVQEVLNKKIKLHDDFFEVGGDSLSIVSCIVHLEEEFQIELDMDLFYLNRTPFEISRFIQNNSTLVQDNKGQNLLVEGKFIENNINKFSGSITTTEASYLQRLYFYKRKNNIISFDIQIPTTISINKVLRAVDIVLEENAILRSSLSKEGNHLKLETHDKIIFYNKEPLDNSYQDEVIKKMIEQVFSNRYLGAPLIDFEIFRFRNHFKITFVVDHCIFDASSINIFKQELMRAILDKKIKKSGISYIDFHNLLNQINNIEIIEHHPYLQSLESSNQHCKDVQKIIPRGFSHIAINNITNYSGTYISYLIAYLTSKKICESYQIDIITSNVILNLRDFPSIDLSDTIGDIHSTVQLIYHGENFCDYVDKCSKIVQEYYVNQLFSPRSVVYSSYPQFSPTQLKLREVIGNNIPISISFVGIVKEEELKNYFLSVEKMHLELDRTSDLARIYVTAVMCKDSLHIFYSHKIFNEYKNFELQELR